MDNYKVLTPKFRQEINRSINEQMQELNTCESNVLVNAQKIGLSTFRNLINSLPDGYLLPISLSYEKEIIDL